MPQAVARWIKAKRARSAADAELNVTAPIIKQWFRDHPKQREYKGQVGYAVTVQDRLDTEKVKAHLGKRLPEFQRPVESETLSLLKK